MCPDHSKVLSMVGLPVTDTDSDSLDSGISRESTVIIYDRDGRPVGKRKRKKKQKLGKKIRKIYDEDGKLIREELIDTDDDGDEMTYTYKNGKKIKKRRVKKTRRITKEITLPNGRKIKAVVEEDYYETVSEHSDTSSSEEEKEEEEEVDPVLSEIREAKSRRRKQRKHMIKKIKERRRDDERLGDGPDPRLSEHSDDPDVRPVDPSDDKDKHQGGKGDVRYYELAPPTEGPVVFRSTYEKKVSKREKESKPGFFRRLFKRKQKKKQTSALNDGKDKEREERDLYMNQYREKKRLEGKLDDEGFWDDEETKKTARDVFGIEKLENILEGKHLDGGRNVPPTSTFHGKRELTPSIRTETDIESREDSETTGQSGQNVKGREETSKAVKTDETDKTNTEGQYDDEKTKKQVTARVSQILTERLFPPVPSDDRKSAMKHGESKKQGRVIFVGEINQKQPVNGRYKKKGELPPLKTPQGQKPYPVHKGPINIDPKKAAMFREGLEKDKNFIISKGAGETDNIQFEEEDHNYDHSDDESRLSCMQRARLKNSQFGPNKRFRGGIREAWGTENASSRRGEDTGKPKVPYTMSAPKFHSYLHFLRGWGQGCTPGNLTDRPTVGRGKSRRFHMDDARLRRLLEELYKDKKYMDTIIAAEERKDEAMVKDLAVYGRDYLIDMALYWEQQGPLPPRPSTTALGFNFQRSKSMIKESEQDSKRPSLQRNKTFS